MNRRWKTAAAVGARVVLSLFIGGICGYLVARWQDAAPDDLPASEYQQEKGAAPPQEPGSEDEGRRRELVLATSSPRLRDALREVETRDAETRARGFRTLRQAGYDPAEIVRLVVRPNVPDWQGRAIADLLSYDPDATLPPLLHRLTHSAPEQRALICWALGTEREDTSAASAVLAVRALLDSFDGVRARALAALQEVEPAAAEAIRAHYAKGLELADGSVAGLDASLLIEDARPFASGRSRRALLDALRADGARFGSPTVIRVGAFLAPLPGGTTWLREVARELAAYDESDSEGVRLLAAVGPDLVPVLRKRLQEPGAPAYVAEILGDMGAYARVSVPELLQVVVEGRPIWRDALRAAVHLSSGNAIGAATEADEADEAALLSFIHDEEMGAHVAWALGAIGGASPEALNVLCVRLTHRVAMGYGAVQAEGALKRLLARGHGFEKVSALLQSDHEGVVRAIIRIISLCHERDREAAGALLENVDTSTHGRAVRLTARRAMKLLSAGEEVREAERRLQFSGLARELEGR